MSQRPIDAPAAAGHFFSLHGEAVLAAVEQAGVRTTGLCYPLNSLENRVYEVEREDQSRVVVKFYRPGRWPKATLLDEHRFLAALVEAEIPVCAPLPFAEGSTLAETADGIFFTLFPRTGGRSPDELSGDDYSELGRLIARMHNVGARLELEHRPILSPHTYGTRCLEILLSHPSLPPQLGERYQGAVERLVSVATPLFAGVQTGPIHADCHRANLLRGHAGWFVLDFDDCAIGPAVQDIWLLLPARRHQCVDELEAFLRGYEAFRAFDRGALGLIEALRGLRYVRYAAWIAARSADPAFVRAFPDFGSERYWNEQISDLYEQIRWLEDGPAMMAS